MHDITPALAANVQLIQSYGAQGFRIGNQNYTQSVLVTPTQTFLWDGVFAPEVFAALLADVEKPEVLLLGTGARHELVPAAFRAALKVQGIASDSMDTGAACRTFNILLGEGRRVAAALTLSR